MSFSARCVVTGQTEDGRSVIESDRRLEADPTGPARRIAVIRLWTAPESPPDLAAPRRDVHLPPGGSSFSIVELPPEGEAMTAPAGAASDTEATRPAGAGDPLFQRSDADPAYHRTETIDYLVVVSGEVWLTVGDEEVHLKAGDCVVQRGTWHKWRNRGSEPCVFVGSMVRARPS